MQHVAQSRRVRISFLSGDVHCAAVGVLRTLAKNKGKPEVPPEQDFRYMLNIVTSTHCFSFLLPVLTCETGAIVNTPCVESAASR
jgi:hypothetical protein